MSAYENLKYTVADGIATITIDRQSKLNALDRRTIEELGAAISTTVDDGSVRGVLLTGVGERAFAAGADISELAELNAFEALEISRLGQRVFTAIETARKPFLAAVNGYALGGGCELAMACHLRVAVPEAVFGLPEVKLGIIPGYGGTGRLPRLIGKARALEMILTGRSVGAEEALAMGLVNRVVARDLLLEAAGEILHAIADNAPLAVEHALECITRGMEMDLVNALALEASRFGLLSSTEDMHEGMRAFLEKRRPRFRGR